MNKYQWLFWPSMLGMILHLAVGVVAVVAFDKSSGYALMVGACPWMVLVAILFREKGS